MHYVCMHKAGPSSESGKRPSKQLIDGMGKLIGEAAANGQLLGGGGLLPSRSRFRLTFRNGDVTVTPGPYQGSNELPAGLTLIKVKTTEEGLDWAKRFGLAAGTDEVELGALTEPWDLGVCPKPENPPLQFMIL